MSCWNSKCKLPAVRGEGYEIRVYRRREIERDTR